MSVALTVVVSAFCANHNAISDIKKNKLVDAADNMAIFVQKSSNVAIFVQKSRDLTIKSHSQSRHL